MLNPDEAESAGSWLFKNKGHGMLSAAASLGMLMMWNVEEGLNHIDKYFHDGDDFVKSGACLGVGIISSGVRNESDPALALLTDYLESHTASTNVRTASAMGLGEYSSSTIAVVFLYNVLNVILYYSSYRSGLCWCSAR